MSTYWHRRQSRTPYFIVPQYCIKPQKGQQSSSSPPDYRTCGSGCVAKWPRKHRYQRYQSACRYTHSYAEMKVFSNLVALVSVCVCFRVADSYHAEVSHEAIQSDAASDAIYTGSFLNFDEIDDLFKVDVSNAPRMRSGATMGVHIPLTRNSTWRPQLARATLDPHEPVAFEIINKKTLGDLEILSGNFRDESGNLAGDNIIVRRISTGGVLNNNIVNGEGHRIHGHKNSKEQRMVISEVGHYYPDEDDSFEDEDFEEDQKVYAEMTQELGLIEGRSTARGATRDSEGNIVMDMLCGMAPRGLAHAGDSESLCAAEVESINLALENTDVHNIKLRLVGVKIYPEADTLGTSGSEGIARAREIMLRDRAAFGADLMTMWLFDPTSSTRGKAYRPGFQSIMEMRALSTLRHEVGHNMGERHCPEDAEANGWRGYRQPETNRGTILCGQDISMFSNTYKTDRGHRVGLPGVTGAHGISAWLQNAERVSAFMPMVVPWNWEHRIQLQRTIVTATGSTPGRETWTIPSGAERVVVWIATRLEQNKEYPMMYISRGSQPTNRNFELVSVGYNNHGTRNNAYIEIKPAVAGTYHLAVYLRRTVTVSFDCIIFAYGQGLGSGSTPSVAPTNVPTTTRTTTRATAAATTTRATTTRTTTTRPEATTRPGAATTRTTTRPVAATNWPQATTIRRTTTRPAASTPWPGIPTQDEGSQIPAPPVTDFTTAPGTLRPSWNRYL
eukprot:Gregarina_sp_Poly_1__9130@NODE_55_length_17436_cov_154_331798_g47_i0_p1_GENE_NODE_55_length_17436_cov_154_331798_g47_i0NODE_55_length_17436_cov_154_331798_g47_i0_p1_ORF_typecomplete_len730_score62_40Reprolysin_3/PF13582_6/6_9e06Reprolysin_3/PF13582_6/1_7e04Reprolysin_5/PF13688_6/0_00011Peptidase_M54/PF07998_11/3_2e03Peptidase_M54/PF07998_11/0_0019Peptidase_M66/PF10462_9/0_0038Reprolysin_4/PF13583_6/0_02PPC/PF04151_15/0_15Reprolysin_2/PF13574_6/0_21Reprolysin_2/PF13574_6/9e03_NODE_55_length_17436